MYKVPPLLLILLSFCIVSCNLTFNKTSPDNELIEYSGRINFSHPDSPEFSYSGASIRAAFEGTSISVKLHDEQDKNEYYAILDGGESIKRFRVKKGSRKYKIAQGLKDTIHEIELIRLTECIFGVTRFEGLILDRRKNIVTISEKRQLLFEFIGNSITCGYGNEGLLGNSFSSKTENHYNTYASITSRTFNARHMAVSRSGIGIYRNHDGPASGSADCMPNIYSQVHHNDSAITYDFEETPDLIFINLGTNDFSTIGCDSTLFVRGYLDFISDVQQKNNNADIICLLGSMLSGENLIKARNYINTVVTNANMQGNGKVSFFELTEQKKPYGINYHPTTNQHLTNAKELVEFVKSEKGWRVDSLQLQVFAPDVIL